MNKIITSVLLFAFLGGGLSQAQINGARPIEKSPANQVCSDAYKSAPADGEWKSLGKGFYYDDLLFATGLTNHSQSWSVEVEESVEQPGYYRFQPYATSPMAEQLSEYSDYDAYMYIDATDPEKIHTDPVTICGYEIQDLVPENGFDSGLYNGYGTLIDGQIYFTPLSHTIYMNGEWMYTTTLNGIRLFLPGAEIKDYTLNFESPLCNDGKIRLDATVGSDIHTVKFMALPGYEPISTTNAATLAIYGEDLDLSYPLEFTINDSMPGIYTLLVMGLDINGEVVMKNDLFVYNMPDNQREWETIGTARYHEGLLFALFDTVESEVLEVEVQENKQLPGFYRLVEPYANHSTFEALTCTSHKHYLYLNATNPNRVYIEANPLGVKTIYGEPAVYSIGSRYYGTANEDMADQYGYYGKKRGNIITMPDRTVFVSMEGLYNGSFMGSCRDFKVELPDKTESIDSVISDGNEPVIYYDMLGRRVKDPAPGQILIRRQGSSIDKTVIRQ